MTAFGDLQIAASAKIGEATWRGRPALAEEEQGQDGLATGEPVLYHWPWYRHLPSAGPWLLLALAIALPRANRHRHALLIFIPLLVLGLLWQRVTKLTGMLSASETQFSFFIDSLAVGMALLWLHADKLGGYHSIPRFLVSLGILLLADLVVVLSYWGMFPGQSSMLLVCTAVMSIVLLISLALTRRLAHKRYDPLRFMLWLAAWSTACSITGVAALVGGPDAYDRLPRPRSARRSRPDDRAESGGRPVSLCGQPALYAPDVYESLLPPAVPRLAGRRR